MSNERTKGNNTNHSTNYSSLISKNIDELTEWLYENGAFDNSPWLKWWDKNYCNRCEEVIGHLEGSEIECEFSYCELHDKCRFFQEMGKVPDNKQVIKMWLESEVE